MSLDKQDIDKISKAISTSVTDGLKDVLKEFGDITNNLGRVITQQKTNIPNSALDYRGSNFGRKVFGEDIESQMRRLTRDLQKQYADTRTATSGARVFDDMTKAARELRYEQDRVKDTIESYKNSVKELKKTYDLLGNSDAEVLDNAKKKFAELGEEVDKIKDKLDDIKNTDFTKAFDFDENGEVLSANIDKVKELKEHFKDISLTEEDIESIAKDQKNGKEELYAVTLKLKELEDERKGIGKDISNTIQEQTESLREQARYADLSISTMKQGFSEISRGFGKLKRLGLDLAEGWRKVDKASSNFAKNIGVGSRGLVALRKNTMDMVANKGIGLNYGIGMEDLINITQNYSKVTGRNVGMTAEDIETGAAMSRLMGDKGGEFATALENFGLSYTEAGKRAGKMFADASKAGLSFEKYSDNFLKNIKMAQKYTFRDGLRGLERMAKKATEIRMDMQNIASFADKVSTLQGAAETSASLQVLGGPFAQFSDPLGMLNEGLNDMEGLMNRVDKMMDGISKFNTTTGQVDMNSFNRIRLREAAKAMNIPYEQLVETAQEKGRRNFVNSQLGGRNDLTDAQREFLMNTATVQDGKAIVSYLDKAGKRVEKNVNEIKAEDIKEAISQNQSDTDNIKSIAKATMSMDERIEGIQKTIEAIKANAIEKPMEWIKDKLGDLSGYLKYIKVAIGIIIGAKALSGVGAVGKGIVNTVRGGGNFLKSGRLFRGFSRAAGGAASASGGAGAGAAGAGAGVAGAVAGLAAVAAGVIKGVSDIKKSKSVKEDRDKAIATGKYKKDSTEDIEATISSDKKKRQGIGGISGTAIGAAIGTAIAPGIGTAIGAAIGWGAGALIGRTTGKKKRERDIAQRHEESIKEQRYNDALKRAGFGLNGGYTTTEYQQIMAAINRGGDNTITKEEFDSLPEELRNKLMASEDVSLFPELQELTVKDATIDTENATINATSVNIVSDGKNKKANGGLLYGPSHAKGGVMVNAEGGEYVVNKEATKENLGLLSAINAKSYGSGGIIPRNNENMQPISVLPNILTNNYYGGGSTSRIEPIDVNINGTIKLDGGNGKNIDMSSLLRDPVFIRQITNILEQEMILNQHGARYTNKLRS